MSLHTEIKFEDDICNHLGANGWFYELGDAANYDSALALYPVDVVAWVQGSQPKSWESLVKTHGAGKDGAEKTLLERLRRQLDERGTLDVLRFGVDMLGLRGSLALAQFKPALGMNPELQANYAANRLRVVRQVRTTHGDIIDLVLFVNGLPVATAELKSEFTQGINEAVEQYRNDRQPRPKGKPSAEPLLDFPRGALVHFAVTNREVMMTTLQPGRRWCGGQPPQHRRWPPYRLPVGAGVGAGELAGDFGSLHGD
jgi:type I restriction enzyme, R subunit